MPVKVGIVGSEAAKFTEVTEWAARREIQRVIQGADLVISGHSPLGGIDWWAIEEAERVCIPTKEFRPKFNEWKTGYMPRNLQIARACDRLVCITVKVLPDGYKGMRFERGCYHCHTPPEDHIKSGGCWTMKRAAEMGKQTELVVIE